MNFKEELITKNIEFNEREFDRYLKFISNCSINEEYNGLIEKHHILPKTLFPEYFKTSLNIKKLTTRQHFLCHWMLAKSLGKNMWFAFNMMRRIGKNSILYSYAREYISNVISYSNSGRKRTIEERLAISERTRNKVCVKYLNDPFGEIHYVSKDDPRYISGEMVFHKHGSKQSEKTKQKMSRNGIKGKTAFIDNEGNNIYLSYEDGIALGYKTGKNEEYKKKCRDNKQNCMWVHVNGTGKDRLIPKDSFDEKLHTKGRKNGLGWKIVNSSDRNKGDNNIMKKSEIVRNKVAEATSRTYNLIDPNLKEYIITSRLENFCKEHGLCRAIILKYLNTNEIIKKGTAKGWKSFTI